jgi:hypothetical protein
MMRKRIWVIYKYTPMKSGPAKPATKESYGSRTPITNTHYSTSPILRGESLGYVLAIRIGMTAGRKTYCARPGKWGLLQKIE